MVKKSLKYILIYFLSAIVAAVGIVYYDTVIIGSNASGDEIIDEKIVLHNIDEIPNGDTAKNLVMEVVMNQAMSLEFMNLDLSCVVETSGITIKIDGVFDVNFEIKDSRISLSGDADIYIGGEVIPAKIIFDGNQIVLYAYGEGFYSSVKDLTQLINSIMSLMGKSPIGQGESTFDPSSLLSSMQNLTVNKDEKNAYVNIPLGELGDVTVLLDYDLNIVGANASNLMVGNTQISLNANIVKYDEKKVISVPDTSAFCNLGQVSDLITSAKPILDEKGIDANVNVVLPQNTLFLNANIDLNDSILANVKLINSADTLRMNYNSGVVLVDYNSIRLKGELNKINLNALLNKPVFSLIKDKFGVDITGKINELTQKTIGIKDLVSIISSIRRYGNKYTFQAFGVIGDLSIGENNITNANIYFDDGKAEIKFNKFSPSKSVYTLDSRVNISDLIPLLDPLYETLKSGKINGEITSNLQFSGENLGGSLKADFFNGVKLQMTTSLLGVKVDAKLIENDIFLDLSNKLFKFNLSDMDKITAILEENGLSLNNGGLINTLKKINKLSLEEGKLTFGYGKIKATILYGTKIESIKIDVGDKTISLSLGEDANIDNVVDGDRTNLLDLLPIVKSTINLVKENAFSISANLYAKIKDKDISLPLSIAADFNSDMILNGKISYQELPIFLTIQDKAAYFSLSNLKFVFPLSDISQLKEFIKENFDIDLTKNNNVAEIIEGIEFSFGENETNVTYKDLSLKVCYENKFTTLTIKYNGLTMSATFDEETKKCEKVLENESYNSYKELTKIVGAINKTISNESLSGVLEVIYKGKLDVETNLQYTLDFSNGLLAEIKSDFYGIDVKGYYQDESVLLNLQGLTTKLELSQINDLTNWINGKFNTTIDLSKEIDIKKVVDNIFVTFDEFGANVTYKDFKIKINYGGTIDNVKLAYKDLIVSGKVSNEIKRLYREPTSIYNSYTYVTNLVDSVWAMKDMRQFELLANAKVFYGLSEIVDERFNAKANLSVDLSDVDFTHFDIEALDAFGHAVVTGESNHDFTLYIENNYIYADYLGLKLSMNIDNLAEVAVIALKALGVDTSKIPLLNEVAAGIEITADNLNNFIPSIDLSNPLNMLSYILNVRLYQDRIELVFDGEKITSGAKEEVKATVYFGNNSVNKISLQNVYTGITEGENFDLTLDLQEFTGKKNVEDPTSYIDISDVSDLLKAFVNTSELKDFALSATAKLRAEIIGIPITMDLPISAKVKIYDDMAVAVEVKMGEIPVIVGVNNDVPYVGGDTNGGESRYLYLYYYEGEFYIYRTEYVGIFLSSPRNYQKMTKVSTQGMIDNILYYLCDYGIGLSDSIMKAINDSVNSERESQINYGNIVKGYSLDKTNNTHKIQLNIGEITGDSKLGIMQLNLYTGEVSGKKYLTKATFNLDMPLASAVNISISTNDLTLDNIGSEVDLTNARNFMTGYPYKQEEEWESAKGNKNWTRTKYKEYTLSFVTNCDIEQGQITSAAGEIIAVPSYEDRVVDEDGYQNTYKFDGWYEKANFDEESKYELNEMPRAEIGTNTTLYAKWTRTKHLKYVNFNIYGGVGIKDSTEIVKEGDTLRELVYNIDNVVVDELGYKNTYAFIGWYFTPDFIEGTEYRRKVVTTSDVSVYAYFSLIESLKYSQFVVNDNNGTQEKVTTILEKDNLPTLVDLSNYYDDDGVRRIDYTFAGYYTTPTFDENTNYLGGTVGKENIYIYAKWESATTYYRTIDFDCKLIDNIPAITVLEGSEITLPTFENYVETIGNTTTTYSHTGFEIDGVLVDQNYIITLDATLTAVWKVVSVEETRSLFIYHEGDLISETRQTVGKNIILPENSLIKSDTKYYLDSGYQNEVAISVMPSEDRTIYLRNQYTISFVTEYDSTHCVNITAYEKQEISLPVLSEPTFDDKNTERRVYTFNGYSDNANRDNSVNYTAMPNFDCTLYSKFAVEVTPYYTVNIKVSGSCTYLSQTGSVYNASRGSQSIKVLKGSTIYISDYYATGKFNIWIFGTRSYNCKTTGYVVNGTNYNNGNNFVVNGNVTMNAVWTKS